MTMPRNEVLNELLKLVSTPHTVITTVVLAAAGDYVAGDVMSQKVTSGGLAWAFPGMAKVKGGSGVIEKAIALCSTTALTPRLSLYLFNELPTSDLDDNDPTTAVIAADKDYYQGKIDFPSMEDLGSGMSDSIATPNTSGNLPLAYMCRSSNNLYGILHTRDGISGEAAGMTMTIILQVRQD